MAAKKTTTTTTATKQAKATAAPKKAAAAPKKAAAASKKAADAPKKAAATPKKAAATPKKATATPKKATATPKKAAATKTATAVASVVPVATAVATPVAAPVSAATETVVEKTQIELLEERFNEIVEQVNSLRNISTVLTKDLKSLRGDVVRVVKKGGKRKRTPLTEEEKANRAPSGFAKPTLISDQLCDFLGKPVGSEVARTEVTKFLSSYIKENKLQDANQKKVIHPDAKLKALLKCDDSTELTFFTIQKYMKDHFKTASSSK